jgi:capsular exopolysaccharide synthesis family protein
MSLGTEIDTNNTANGASASIDVNRLIKSVLKYKYLIVGFSLLITLFAIVFVSTLKPSYESTTRLIFDSAKIQTVSVKEVYSVENRRQSYSATQMEILKSHSIAREVIDRVGLYQTDLTPETKSWTSSLKEQFAFLPTTKEVELTEEKKALYESQRQIELFLLNLKVKPVGWTELVDVSFTHSDPSIAAEVANAVSDVYIESQMASKLGMNEKANEWLNVRLDELRIRLDEAQTQLQAYREKENIVDIDGSVSKIDNEVDLLKTKLNSDRLELEKLKYISKLIKKYGDSEKVNFIPEVKSQDSIKEANTLLVNAELVYSNLAKTYGKKHPKLLAAADDVKTLKQKVKKNVLNFIDGISDSIVNMELRISEIERLLAQTQAKYQQVTKKELVYHKLVREVEASKTLYNQFLTRSKETQVTGDFNAAPARIITKAFEARYPVAPNKKKIIILTFLLSLFMAVGLAVLVEILNDTFKNTADIESVLAQRVLGTMPLIEVKKGEHLETHQFFNDNNKPFSEAIRTFRTNLVLTNIDNPSKIIEVTSSSPSEGKTTTSINLAFSLGQMEKVILIDADMRKPSICKRFNIPNYHPGLANLIAGTDKFEDCIYTDEKSGITVMPCGQLPPNPLELLSSEKFGQVLAELEQSFSRIIIDTAPVQAVSDAMIIAKHAQAIVFVVKADSTRTGHAKNALGKLLQHNAKVTGVVLSQLDMKQSDNAYEYGYYEYGEKSS